MDGMIAVATGASRGIGRGVAQTLGEIGATVVVTGRDAAELEETAGLVRAADGQPDARICDQCDDDAVQAVFDHVAATYGSLDLLVNSATAVGDVGQLFTPTPFWHTPPARWDELFAVGLRSHFVAAQHVAAIMPGQGRGVIVNVSSAAAAFQVPAILPYGVAKAALDRMTLDMARDLSPHGVTVVGVWPPPSSTEGMLASAGADDDITQWSLPVVTDVRHAAAPVD